MKKIAITGAAGQIAYSLLFRIANGDFLGKEESIQLHLLDVPDFLGALKGVRMELDDCAFPLLKNVVLGTRPEEVFEGVDYTFLVGAKPRGPGMERKDLLADNGKIFQEQGRALNKVASKEVKVLIVGNPCNTNCLIAMHNAPDIPRKNFHAMTRLDQNRAQNFLAKQAHVGTEEVSRVTIWGNHSSTQVPDYFNAKIQGKRADSVLEETWLKDEFVSLVQKRGADVILARGKSSAASAANAAIGAMKDISGSCSWFSSGVDSCGNPYGFAEELVFSFPCRSQNGEWEWIAGCELDSFLQEKIAITQKELIEERDLVRGLLS